MSVSSNYSFQDQDPVYLFTNENACDTLRVLGGVDGKRVLTVGASGDHAFQAYHDGATHVDTFDINSAQNCVTELKTKMIKNLDYSKFMDFFFEEREFFNQKIIKPLYRQFSPELMMFLAKYIMYGTSMFRYRGATCAKYIEPNISYIRTAQNYDALREKLPEKIEFKHCGLGCVTSQFSGKYDVILLSNIFDYLYMDANMCREPRMKRFYDDILKPIAQQNLSQNNGCICLHYMWNANHGNWANFMSHFDRAIVQNPSHQFSARVVDSVYRGRKSDVVLIMAQNQK